MRRCRPRPSPRGGRLVGSTRRSVLRHVLPVRKATRRRGRSCRRGHRSRPAARSRSWRRSSTGRRGSPICRDLLARADVDALGGLVEQQHRGLDLLPLGEERLLLVAAGERAVLQVGPGGPDVESASSCCASRSVVLPQPPARTYRSSTGRLTLSEAGRSGRCPAFCRSAGTGRCPAPSPARGHGGDVACRRRPP